MISPSIRGVYRVNVKGILKYRDMKHCVCVSVGAGMYLYINTNHRENFNDFQISAANYDFLEGVDRFISCLSPTSIPSSNLIQKVGELNEADARTIYVKIQESTMIHNKIKKIVLPELWKTFR